MVPIPLSHVFSIYEQVPCGSKETGMPLVWGGRGNVFPLLLSQWSQSLKKWK
ncbi:Hypothetical protein FKW44_021433 [Caligus rogercresseyi]|uniref:Uncharacterized protein n=1 Tax=Caligus rogercresseyi TaxID=217165 RepID=A0A7T8GRR4_CALRO|nr:Hypothetical protein FKW44_021433 [Caligus rogercresseyi]